MGSLPLTPSGKPLLHIAGLICQFLRLLLPLQLLTVQPPLLLHFYSYCLGSTFLLSRCLWAVCGCCRRASVAWPGFQLSQIQNLLSLLKPLAWDYFLFWVGPPLLRLEKSHLEVGGGGLLFNCFVPSVKITQATVQTLFLFQVSVFNHSALLICAFQPLKKKRILLKKGDISHLFLKKKKPPYLEKKISLFPQKKRFTEILFKSVPPNALRMRNTQEFWERNRSFISISLRKKKIRAHPKDPGVFGFVERKKKWSHSVVSDFVTPWTVAYQAPPSMRFSRQAYWSGVPFFAKR